MFYHLDKTQQETLVQTSKHALDKENDTVGYYAKCFIVPRSLFPV